jgi:hypothetical protein
VLPLDQRAEELEYVEEELARLRPIPHPQACVIDGVGPWEKLLVSATYPHNVGGVIYAPEYCARMLGSAIPAAIGVAYADGIGSVAATLIGTAYRMSPDLAVLRRLPEMTRYEELNIMGQFSRALKRVRAFVDGLRAAAHRAVVVRWSLPDPAHYQLASSAAERLEMSTRTRINPGFA